LRKTPPSDGRKKRGEGNGLAAIIWTQLHSPKEKKETAALHLIERGEKYEHDSNPGTGRKGGKKKPVIGSCEVQTKGEGLSVVMRKKRRCVLKEQKERKNGKGGITLHHIRCKVKDWVGGGPHAFHGQKKKPRHFDI